MTSGPLRGGGAVIVGGLVGTGLRLGLDAALPHSADGFPVSTLIENLTGALVLGVLVAGVWPTAPAWLRLGLGTGLLGSYTTFSALAVSLVQLAERDAAPLAVVYLAVSLLAGLAAAGTGLSLGARIARRGPTAPGEPGVDE